MIGKTRSGILIAACLATLGCTLVGGTRYYPKQLKSSPPEAVCRIAIPSQLVSGVKVDGVKVDGMSLNPLHTSVIAPGKHTMTFSTVEKTQKWAAIIQSMESKGFTLAPDGKSFVDTLGGKVATPIGVGKRYHFVPHTLTFCTEAGKYYSLGDDVGEEGAYGVFSEGVNAGC